jgi:OOP family OmpA-OmpF porin
LIRRSFPIVLLVLALGAGTARAEESKLRITGTGYGGLAILNNSWPVQDGIDFGIRGGFNIGNRVGLEFSYGKIASSSSVDPRRSYPVDQYGLDLLYYFKPDSQRLIPYAFLGWGQLDLDKPDGTAYEMSGIEFGGGGRYRLWKWKSFRFDGRLDGRALIATNDPPLQDAGSKKIHYFLTLGLTFARTGPEADADKDGVPDRIDRCPDTPEDTPVDPRGCALDEDGDGVPDGSDQCPGTPPGIPVDGAGCAPDTDGDGVPDALDHCADTPVGATVDSTGCSQDTDGDGVSDGIDRCPDTPPGVRVDAAGCPLQRVPAATKDPD